MAQTIPTHAELRETLQDEEECIAFLFANGIFIEPSLCTVPGCEGHISHYGTIFQRTKGACRKKRSIFQNSFLAKSHLKGHEILTPGYFWPCISPSKPLHRISGHSSATICDYASHFRGLVTESLDSNDAIIGGPGIMSNWTNQSLRSINITEDITFKVLGSSEAWKEANKSLYLQRSLRTGWLIRYWT